MFRYLAIGVLLSALVLFAVAHFGCRLAPPPTVPARIETVTTAQLARECRDGTKDRTGQTVCIVVDRRDYTLVHGAILWHAGPTDRPPAIRFVCRPPVDTDRTLEILGTIRRVERDQIDRGSGVNFTIWIDDCSIALR